MLRCAFELQFACKITPAGYGRRMKQIRINTKCFVFLASLLNGIIASYYAGRIKPGKC